MGLVSSYGFPTECAVVGLTLYVALIVLLKIVSPRPRPPTRTEQSYVDALTKVKAEFPSLTKERELVNGESITLSVIVPAFNETSRLPIMLQETVDYLDARSDRDKTFRYEVIVVDDGSTDDTSGTALKFAKEYAERLGAKKYREREIRVMTLEKNRGKGGAVTQGMMVARGELLLFADADGATKFSEVEKLEASAKAIEERGLSIAVGSRAHMLKTDAVVKRSFIRNLLMRAFHLIVFVLGIASIDDTQCGFKLVTRRAGQIIFPNMHAEGWIFDIELLLIAINLEIPIAEVPVKWHEVEGTKMSLIKDSIIMLKDLLVIRLNYTLGLWRLADKQKVL